MRGQGLYTGLRMGYEYDIHDYDRDRARPVNVIASASPVGVALAYDVHAGALRVTAGFDAFGSISGVTPYALEDYLGSSATQRDGLPTAVRTANYYHGFGTSASPRVELQWRDLTLDTRLRLDHLSAIEGLDPENETVDRSIELSDRRSSMRARLGWEPSVKWLPIRMSLGAERTTRAGRVGDARATRHETSLTLTLGLVL